MKNAPATAAQNDAPQAVPEPKKQPAWLTMPEADFEAYVVSAKIGAGSKRAGEMRDRRKDYAVADDAPDHTFVATAGNPDAPGIADNTAIVQAVEVFAPAFSKAVRRRKTRAEVVQAAIALDNAPPDALRTRYVDPRLIDIREGWNARFDFGDLEELAASIKAQKALDGHGLTNDIRVKEKADGRYELIDGERRYHAVMGLIDRGEEFAFGIPAKVEDAEATDADLIIKMFTANMGKQFLPIEEAHYYKRLQDSGLTISQIEAKTGRSDNSIVGALALLTADEDLVEAVTKGQIGATIAKGIAVNARGDRAKQKELTAKARAAGKDRVKLRGLKKDIDDARRAKAAKQMPGLKLKIRALDDTELAALGTNVGLRLRDLMEQQGMPHDSAMEQWVAGDRELQIAAAFGALQALKAAAGVKADLEFAGKKGH